jgi:hypothetical protein
MVPVDPRYLGLWLTGLFGDPDTTNNGDGSFDHEFASGGDDLPSYTLEVGMPKVPAFLLHAGVKLNSIGPGRASSSRRQAMSSTMARSSSGSSPMPRCSRSARSRTTPGTPPTSPCASRTRVPP